MRLDHPTKVRGLSFAACAVAMAATVGGAHAANEDTAIEGIQKYCIASFRNAGIAQDAWQDCSQSVMADLLQRVSRKGIARSIEVSDSEERRELNRSIWCAVQRVRRAAKTVSLDEHPMFERAAEDRRTKASEAMNSVMSVAGKCLSDRQQRILALCRDGWSVAEIAEQLDISAPRVSDEKFKAIRKLREQMAGEEIVI